MVTLCFTNSYFSGQYFNYKIILEFLNEYCEAKIPYKSLFSNYNHLPFLMPFYEQKTLVLCQSNNLHTNATNCEIFHISISHAKYLAKYSKPLFSVFELCLVIIVCFWSFFQLFLCLILSGLMVVEVIHLYIISLVWQLPSSG